MRQLSGSDQIFSSLLEVISDENEDLTKLIIKYDLLLEGIEEALMSGDEATESVAFDTVDTLKQTYSITFIKTLVTIKKAQMKQRFLVTG